jgi:hypothetical protein
MKIRTLITLTADHRINGRLHRAGRVVNVGPGTAAFLIRTQRGIAAESPPVTQPQPPTDTEHDH